MSSEPIRLIIFGDSWAKSEIPGITPWPELLGQHMNWSTLNVAVPGTTSEALLDQADSLKEYLTYAGATLHKDAWALVHAGGNDMLHAVLANPVRFALEATARSMLCCSTCCCQLNLFEQVASNMQALAHQLYQGFGVKNVMFVGLPLTAAIPVVDQLVAMLKEQLPYLAPIAPFVMRRLNSTHNAIIERHLQNFVRSSGHGSKYFQTLVLDEAFAIESAIDVASQSAASGCLFLGDGLHLTRHGHKVLANEMFTQISSFLHADLPYMSLTESDMYTDSCQESLLADEQ